MTTFNEREKGFETKYQRDQETEFKVVARRNKLLGLWAAEQMGITGTAADAYAKDVVAADFEEPGDDDVVRKVLGDFSGKNVAINEHKLRLQMERLMEVAREQIHNENKG